jgi:hypothetical protein
MNSNKKGEHSSTIWEISSLIMVTFISKLVAGLLLLLVTGVGIEGRTYW